MRQSKRQKLESRGWKVGDAKDFLGLSKDEAAYIELRLKLAVGLKARRHSRGVTQSQLAHALKSSQSRVAKMEAADRSVSLDLLVRSLFKLGAQPGDIARALRPARKLTSI